MEPVVMIILIIVVIILLLWVIFGYNGLQKARMKVEEAESGIDVALNKRFDVLTKMVETVKGYAKHESESLEKIVDMRNVINISDTSIIEKQDISHQMDEVARHIHVIAKQYPDLMESENFKTLQITINDVEEHLQAARRVYNSNVSSYNQKVQVFPSNVIAKLFKFTSREFFETEDFKHQDMEMRF